MTHPDSSEEQAHEGGLEPITFIPSRQLTPLELSRLARLAGTMGLAPVESLGPVDREGILQEHITHTYPQTSEDFIAREHLWILGEEAGIDSRKTTGALFTELCFTRLRNVWRNNRNRHDPIDPETLGLIVKNREDVGLPQPPIPMGRGAYRRVVVEGREEGCVFANDVAIQIRGVAELDNGQHGDLNRYFAPMSRLALQVITPRLREFV